MIIGFVEYEDLDIVHRFLHPVRQLGDGFPDHFFEVDVLHRLIIAVPGRGQRRGG